MDVEEVGSPVAGDTETVEDLRRYEHPRFWPCRKLAIFEPERKLSLEDEEALRMPSVGVQRRIFAAGLRTDVGDAYLLEVSEERDTQLGVSCDPLALAGLHQDRLHGAPA